MLLANLVTRPSLRQTDFDRVRQLRLDRLRQLKDLAPAAAERAFLRLLYDGHPYGHLAIGNDAALRALAEERGIKAGVLIHPTRMALSGAAAGPPLFDLVEVMGREATARHFDRFIAFLRTPASAAPEGNTFQPPQG